MVRELRFDISELAIATFLQAKAYGKPLVLIPATIMGRFQHGTILYSAARGTSQNYVQAHEWFSVAASRYPASERAKRAQAIRNSELLAQKMSRSEIEEAKKLAREWQPKT